MNSKAGVILLVSACLLGLAFADLPVHCRKDQITGNWKFELSDPLTKAGEYNSCWHSQPDKQSSSFRAGQTEFVSSKSIEFTLFPDDTVQDSNKSKGDWTMVYDQGFDIKLGGQTYFVFSKYTHDGGKYESYCSETLVGWYADPESGKQGCCKGTKTDGDAKASDSLDQISVVQPKDTQTNDNDDDDDDDADFVQNDALTDAINKADVMPADMEDEYDDDVVSEKKKSKKSKKKSHKNDDYYNFDDPQDYDFNDDGVINGDDTYEDEDIYSFSLNLAQTKSEQKVEEKKRFKNIEETDNTEYIQLHHDFKEHEKVVTRLNKVQKDWVAAVPESFSDFDIKTMNRYAGRRKYGNRANAASSQFAGASSFVQTESSQEDDSKKWQNYSREDLSDLPAEYSAKDLINEPIQQKDCGSCYAIATMEMLSARLKKKGENVFLSVQHALDCNYYNQGCDGGYGYLVNKFFSENDLVPESCAPYRGEDGSCSVCDAKKLSKTYKVKNFGFIGGAYGKSSERQMMKEIHQNGPIVVSFEPAYDFMYYSSGIYHSVDAEDWILKGERQPDWEKVDHSVLAYGWGITEDGKKYWNVLNSWGKGWGENGHFRMRRGTDESHIESMGEHADPYVVNKGSSFVQTEETEEPERTFLGLSEQKSFKNNN